MFAPALKLYNNPEWPLVLYHECSRCDHSGRFVPCWISGLLLRWLHSLSATVTEVEFLKHAQQDHFLLRRGPENRSRRLQSIMYFLCKAIKHPSSDCLTLRPLIWNVHHALAQGLQGSSADWLSSGLQYWGSFHSKLNRFELNFE